jgi:hypothetical protein
LKEIEGGGQVGRGERGEGKKGGGKGSSLGETRWRLAISFQKTALPLPLVFSPLFVFQIGPL